jgi:hypothetical protein
MTSAVPASSYLRVRKTSTTLTITTPGRRPPFAWISLSFLSSTCFFPAVASTSHPSLCLLVPLVATYVLLLPFFERSIFQVQRRKWITRQRHTVSFRLGPLLKSRSGSGATKYLLGAKVLYSAPFVVLMLEVRHNSELHFSGLLRVHLHGDAGRGCSHMADERGMPDDLAAPANIDGDLQWGQGAAGFGTGG